MSDIIVDTLRIDGGIILVINPPLAYDEKVVLRFINKISREDKSSFLFPALYGNFDCVEGEIVSDGIYDLYDGFKKEVIKAQNEIKSTHISDEFEALIQSSIYVDFLNEFDFTASETLILKGLFKYAFLTGISVNELIQEIKENIGEGTNKKQLRKEFINVLRQRLS